MEDRNLAVAKPGPVASEPTRIIRAGPSGGL
jgi:hypothetical protein